VFLLKNRAIISVTGLDSSRFLQDIITNDIGNASYDSLLYAMLLTPQGKFLSDLFIRKIQNGFYLDIPTHSKDSIIKKLNMYKLRADVQIEDISDDYKVYASHKMGPEFSSPDPRDPSLGYRSMSDRKSITSDGRVIEEVLSEFEDELNEDTYEITRINLKIPDADADFIYEKSFPLEYNAVEINAVNFNKGCYIGQEVITRTYNRGVVRKKLFLLESLSTTNPAKGETIFFEFQDNTKIELGISLGFYGNIGLGLLNIEKAIKYKDETLTALNTLNNTRCNIKILEVH
jgi:folate-binding protein YgfZ